MITDKHQTLNTIETEMLHTMTLIDEVVYERYCSGELSFEQLQEFYSLAKEWSIESEKLLTLLVSFNEIKKNQQRSI